MATIEITSEIPGNVWKLEVTVGDRVEDGAAVVTLESMKMEVPIVSSVSGTVIEILVAEGDFVGEGDRLLVIEI